MINSNTSAILYLISAILFILALKGLSSPESARRGNIYGITGMILAIFTTLAQPNINNVGLPFIAISLGGLIGTIIALKIKIRKTG